MNELQQVLLVFAAIVVVGLYLFSRQRQSANKKQRESEGITQTRQEKYIDESALRSDAQDSGMESAALDHSKQPFWENFESRISSNPVFEIDEIREVDPAPQAAPQTVRRPSYQPPEQQKTASPTTSRVAEPLSEPKTEPQVFAILVLTASKEFSLPDVAQTLRASGLGYSDKGTYIKTENGRTIIQVANVMEPGTFPADPLATDTTPGVALILQLPAAVPAPRAMDDLIMTARRVSQRLNGRMYDMHRHLIRESDLQGMREEALNYQSTRLSS
jgi:cell division protein ZipA